MTILFGNYKTKLATFVLFNPEEEDFEEDFYATTFADVDAEVNLHVLIQKL